MRNIAFLDRQTSLAIGTMAYIQEEPVLTEHEKTRYMRQIIFPSLGEDGQNKLKAAKVVVAGVGGLGSPVSIYLAYAGVGHIKLVDYDTVSLSNLNRQILYTEDNIGQLKVLAAAEVIKHMNPYIEVSAIPDRITGTNVREIIRGATVVVDAMDNFETRLVLNTACVADNIPFVHAGVYGLVGELMTILPGQTPCLACFFPNSPRKTEPPPIFGVTPGFMAAFQAAETIKLVAGFGKLMTARMLYVNAETMEFRMVNISRRVDCPVCGKDTFNVKCNT
jgi:adenylyltransferase/sulfurtransferase